MARNVNASFRPQSTKRSLPISATVGVDGMKSGLVTACMIFEFMQVLLQREKAPSQWQASCIAYEVGVCTSCPRSTVDYPFGSSVWSDLFE